MEVVFVLIFITIMMAILFSLFTSITSSQRNIESNEDLSRITIQVARSITSLPYISCAGIDSASDFCVDTGRMNAMSTLDTKIIEESLFSVLGQAQVLIWTVNDPNNVQIVYNQTPSVVNVRRAKRYPITVYDPLSDQRRFGLIEVRVYQ